MSTITLDTQSVRMTTTASPSVRASASEKPSLVSRLVEAMTASRQAQADRAVADHLKQYSDAQLANFGYTTEDIAHFRGLSGGIARPYPL